VPTYAYACTDCGHDFEIVQSFSDDSLTVCPECEGRLRKVFANVGVVFKGSGFYRNDSRGPEKTSGGSSEKSSGSSGDKSSGDKSSGDQGSSTSSDKSSSDKGSSSSSDKSSSDKGSSGSGGSTEKKSSAKVAAKSS
jgi:putative FmdB family regulatory protein